MKFHLLGLLTGRHHHELDLPDDDSVHKRSKHSDSEEPFSKEKEPAHYHHIHHHHHHDDDRTETTQTSCASRDSPKAAPIPLHIGQNNNSCDAIPEVRSAPVVRFSTVETREYRRIVGDHPDVEIPLAIGWEYVQDPIVSVDTFQEEKQLREKQFEKELQLPFTTTHPGVIGPMGSSRLSSSPPAPNRKGSKVLQRAAAFTENVRAGVVTHNKGIDSIQPKYLEPISQKERVFLLKKVSGLSLKDIHQAERRRRVQMVHEWAYR